MPASDIELEQQRTLCKQWSRDWCQPAIDALTTENIGEARAHIAAARQELAGTSLPEPVYEALSYLVDMLSYQIDWYPPSDSWNLASFEQAAAHFDKPAGGPS